MQLAFPQAAHRPCSLSVSPSPHFSLLLDLSLILSYVHPLLSTFLIFFFPCHYSHIFCMCDVQRFGQCFKGRGNCLFRINLPSPHSLSLFFSPRLFIFLSSIPFASLHLHNQLHEFLFSFSFFLLFINISFSHVRLEQIHLPFLMPLLIQFHLLYRLLNYCKTLLSLEPHINSRLQ